MKTKSVAELIGMLEKNIFLFVRGSLLDASNNKSFSAGTEGQLGGLSLEKCTEESIEKTKYLLSRDVADINQIL